MDKYTLLFCTYKDNEKLELINKYISSLKTVSPIHTQRRKKIYNNLSVYNESKLICKPSSMHMALVTFPWHQDHYENVNLEYFYEWLNLYDESIDVLSQNMTKIAEKNSNLPMPAIEFEGDQLQFMTDVVHHLLDCLPESGSYQLEVVIFVDVLKDLNTMRNSPDFLGCLKRLEVWHQASFRLVVQPDSTEDYISSMQSWLDVAHMDIVYEDPYFEDVLWEGQLRFITEKNSGEVAMHRCKLLVPSIDCQFQDMNVKETKEIMEESNTSALFVDHTLDVLACLKKEDLPLQMIIPVKYTLKCSSLCNDSNFTLHDVVKLLPSSCLLARLKFDHRKRKKSTHNTNDWISFVLSKDNQSFSHLKQCSPLPLHLLMIIQLPEGDKSKEDLDVYFLQCPEDLDSSGFLRMITSCVDFQVNNGTSVESKENICPCVCKNSNSCQCCSSVRSMTHAAEVLPIKEWPERMAWMAEENRASQGKSILRCKSDEMYLGGVMKPAVDTIFQRTFSEVKSLFTREGRIDATDLKPIPLAMDRLYKNVKTEDEVKNLSYHEACKLVGHGVEYCMDSLNALRLDARLAKVQRRFVPDDTSNLNAYLIRTLCGERENVRNMSKDDKKCQSANKRKKKTPTKKEPTLYDQNEDMTNVKTNNADVIISKNDKLELRMTAKAKKFALDERIQTTKESRSQRHKRRLRTIVEATIEKHGKVNRESPHYEACCNRLFTLCLNFVKDLKSSTGLNEEMKRIAKSNVLQVVDFEQRRK